MPILDQREIVAILATIALSSALLSSVTILEYVALLAFVALLGSVAFLASVAPEDNRQNPDALASAVDLFVGCKDALAAWACIRK